jgi:hypothetical protein
MGGQSRCPASALLRCASSTGITLVQVNEDEEQILFIKTAAHRKQVMRSSAPRFVETESASRTCAR